MAYTLGFGGARVSGLAPSTACVLLGAGVLASINAQVPGWAYFTRSGGTFTAYSPATYGPPPTNTLIAASQNIGAVALAVGTLASVVAGDQVLADPGNGNWVVAQVVSDGVNQVFSGQALPASTVASAPSTANGQTPPPVGQAATLLGSASDGTMSFSVANVVYFSGAQSTVGAVGSGVVFAKVGGTWQVVQL